MKISAAPKILIYSTIAALFASLAPQISSAAPKVAQGVACKSLNKKSIVQNKTYTCIKKNNKLVWSKGVSKTSSNQSSPTPTTKTITYQPPTEPSDNVELCKMKENSSARGSTGAGFPVWNSLTPNKGIVKWAIVPIDFPDLPGESNFRPRIDEQMKLLSDWFDVVSEGKFKVEWVVMNEWATLPEKSTEYRIENSNNVDRVSNGPKLYKDAIAASDPKFDFTNVTTVNFLLPKGQTFLKETSQGFPWDQVVKDTKTKEGSINSYSIAGMFMDEIGREYWSYWAHEFGHAIGLPHIGSSRGEVPPFNPFDLMGGQDGPTRELSGWLRFFGAWLPDERVFCKELINLKSTDITLVPLSNSDSGIKFTVIPVSKTKAVLVESRRFTKFSCGLKDKNGVLVYTYDATLGHGENFLNPIAPAGRTAQGQGGSACLVAPFADPLLYKGNKVTVEGVTIEVLDSANFDRIRVSKNN